MKNIPLKIFPYISGVLGSALAVYLGSRALAFGFLVALFIINLLYHKTTLKFIITGLIILCTILSFMVFLIKSDSSLGRILIYKISFQIFKDNWFLGVGLGNFQKIYLYQQANYFGKQNYTDKELLLADNTHYAFNDYWQLVTETGIIGFIVLGALIYFLYRLLVRASKIKKYGVLTSNIMLMLVAVLTAAFFTHIFEKLMYQTLIVICVTYLCLLIDYKKWFKSVITSIALVFLLCIGANVVKSYQIKNNYKTALKLYLAGLKNECKLELLKIYPIEDNKRGVFYLQVLLFTYDLKNEKEILALLPQYPNANTYKLLGDFYLFNDKIKEAENAYLMSINMVPNRFVPRQTLLRLYIVQKKFIEAEKVANNIIYLSVKINSKQVNNIKQEASNFLSNQNKNL